jgi:hypothetical protein
MTDLIFPFDNPIMAFTKDVGLKGHKEIEGFKIVFPVGKKAFIKGAVDILPKKHLEPLRLSHVDNGARGMSGCMYGLYKMAP